MTRTGTDIANVAGRSRGRVSFCNVESFIPPLFDGENVSADPVQSDPSPFLPGVMVDTVEAPHRSRKPVSTCWDETWGLSAVLRAMMASSLGTNNRTLSRE